MEYGITSLPALVYFDKRIPNIYCGDHKTADILDWMTEQVIDDCFPKIQFFWQTEGSHIEEISPALLETLVRKHDDLTVFFYDKVMFI